MKKLVIALVALTVVLAACQKNEETIQPQDGQVVVTENLDPACIPDDASCNDLAEDFVGVPGLENVIQALPGPNLTNAPSDAEVTVLYRSPITTPVDELAGAITLKNSAGEAVPGSLTLVEGNQLIRFCADKALPSGSYTVSYKPVTLKGGEKVEAFTLNFEVDPELAIGSNDLPPCTFIEKTVGNDTPLASS